MKNAHDKTSGPPNRQQRRRRLQKTSRRSNQPDAQDSKLDRLNRQRDARDRTLDYIELLKQRHNDLEPDKQRPQSSLWRGGIAGDSALYLIVILLLEYLIEHIRDRKLP